MCSHQHEAVDLGGKSHKEAKPMTARDMGIINEASVNSARVTDEGNVVQAGKVETRSF